MHAARRTPTREPRNLPGREGAPRPLVIPESLDRLLSEALAHRAALGRGTYPRFGGSAPCDECVNVLHEITGRAKAEAVAGGATTEAAAARAMDLTRGLAPARARLERAVSGLDASTKIRLCTGHGTLWQQRDTAATTRR